MSDRAGWSVGIKRVNSHSSVNCSGVRYPGLPRWRDSLHSQSLWQVSCGTARRARLRHSRVVFKIWLLPKRACHPEIRDLEHGTGNMGVGVVWAPGSLAKLPNEHCTGRELAP